MSQLHLQIAMIERHLRAIRRMMEAREEVSDAKAEAHESAELPPVVSEGKPGPGD